MFEENLRNLREQVAESSLDASLSQGSHSCACLEQTTSSQAARSAQPEKAALGRLQLQLPRCPAVDHRTLTRQPLSDLREQGKGKGRKSFNFNSSSFPFLFSFSSASALPFSFSPYTDCALYQSFLESTQFKSIL